MRGNTMLNMNDILETITMIQEENLDIRTITMGISLLDCADSDAEKAWEILKETVYSKGYSSLTLLTSFPSLKPEHEGFYDNPLLADAWMYMLNASGKLGNMDTYRFDLVNIARQVFVQSS